MANAIWNASRGNCAGGCWRCPHKKFSEKYKLNFALLSDPDGKMLETYGAWGDKNMYGKKTQGHHPLDRLDRWRPQGRRHMAESFSQGPR